MGKVEKFDERGNLLYSKEESYGFELWCEYDKNNNEIHCKNSDGIEAWREYNENNRIVYWKNNIGHEIWYKWENNEQIKITKQELKQIERTKL